MTAESLETTAAPPAADLPALNPNFKSAKVLVIDDTAEIRMIISESLKIYGFTTLAAEDGVSGVEMAREHAPDLIICDINMPNMDGLELLGHIKSNEEWRKLPVIMITTEGAAAKVKEAVELGATGYVRKPFTAEQIKEKLAGLL